MATKDEIMEVLNRKAMSVSEMAERFGVTRNAINVPLRQLESAGLVSKAMPKPDGQVGKPAAVYSAAPGSEDSNSRAYRPFATMFASAVAATLDEKHREHIYEVTGKAMAAEAAVSDGMSLEDRLLVATRLVDDLGAATVVENQKSSFVVRSFTCPVAAIVRTDPCVCASLRAFFEDVTGRPVVEQCGRNEKIVCQFEIKK